MTNVNDLGQAKKNRVDGVIPREDYWQLVRSSLASASKLSKLLESSGAYLKISSSGTVLSYPLTPSTDVDFIVDSEDTRSIGVSVVSDGPYEPLLQKALLEISRDCKLFIDVGANAGFYSISVRATSKKCNVVAFECNPDIRNLFLRNIQLNSISGIEVRSEALAESPGKADFHVPAFTGSGGGSLQNLHPEEGTAQKFQVDLVALDSFRLKGVDLMKIDVEGAELGVINGSLSSINSSKPTIFIELLRKWMAPFGANPGDVSTLLLAMGYRIFEISEEGIIPVNNLSSETAATNFVFIHPKRAGHLKRLQGLVSKSKD
jgi:FkbM family methyltransferase